MPRAGPSAVRKYSDEFKLTAVRFGGSATGRVTVANAFALPMVVLNRQRLAHCLTGSWSWRRGRALRLGASLGHSCIVHGGPE